ncbi:Hsp20/alpha crystallin family protein [Candidatus Pacearchaeota archaeon]|nr:Hsp20/alpha crystallin family protein [Candidatus Pacearchaeota archaeon]
MSFFDDDNDPFDSIVREFFGGSPIRRGKKKQQFIQGEEEDRKIDFVDDEKKVYVVFELPGFTEKDVSVRVHERELEIIAKKRDRERMQDYLSEKLERGIVIKKELPNFVNPKKFSHTMRNGILEVVFEKR